MYRKEGIRWVSIPLLALLLAAPAAAGERTYREGAAWLGGGLWQRLVQWVQVEILGATQCDAGSYIDPNGRCITTAAASQCEAGSSIDPDGRCVATAAATQCEKGSSIDPNGGCITGDVRE